MIEKGIFEWQCGAGGNNELDSSEKARVWEEGVGKSKGESQSKRSADWDAGLSTLLYSTIPGVIGVPSDLNKGFNGRKSTVYTKIANVTWAIKPDKEA